MEHSSAVKFNMGYEKNMSFLVTPKSPKVRKKCWKSDWAPSMLYMQDTAYCTKVKNLKLYFLKLRRIISRITGPLLNVNSFKCIFMLNQNMAMIIWIIIFFFFFFNRQISIGQQSAFNSHMERAIKKVWPSKASSHSSHPVTTPPFKIKIVFPWTSERVIFLFP